MARDITIRYVLTSIDRGTRQVVSADRAVRTSVEQTNRKLTEAGQVAVRSATQQVRAATQVHGAQRRTTQATNDGTQATRRNTDAARRAGQEANRQATAYSRLMGVVSRHTSAMRASAQQSARNAAAAQRDAAAQNRLAAAYRRVTTDAGAAASRQAAAASAARQSAGAAGAAAAATGRMGGYAALGGAAAGFGLTQAVKDAVSFEYQMKRVQAVSESTRSEFRAMTRQAMELGATTQFSAKESAEGMYSLATAGFKAQEIMKTMGGTLDLAAASASELGFAAETQAAMIRQFGLNTTDATHVADVLTAAVNRSAIELYDLAETMKYVGPVAGRFNQSFEDMAASAAIVGNVGIKGSQAGTTLRRALVNLVKPSERTLNLLDSMGISADEFAEATVGASGKLRPLPTILGNLGKHFDELSDPDRRKAIAQLFGVEALPGMITLFDKGQKAIDGVSKSLENSDGVARKTAEVMRKSVAGAWDNFTGSVETASITLTKRFMPDLRAALNAAADSVNDLVRSVATGRGQGFFADMGRTIRDAAGMAGDLIDELKPLGPLFENVILPAAKGFGSVIAIGWKAAIAVIGTLADILGAVGEAAEAVPGSMEAIGAVLAIVAIRSGMFSRSTSLVGRTIAALLSPVTGLVRLIERLATAQSAAALAGDRLAASQQAVATATRNASVAAATTTTTTTRRYTTTAGAGAGTATRTTTRTTTPPVVVPTQTQGTRGGRFGRFAGPAAAFAIPAGLILGGGMIGGGGQSGGGPGVGDYLANAGTGAMIGSVIPGIGTAVGAVGGALVGGLITYLGNAKDEVQDAVDDMLKPTRFGRRHGVAEAPPDPKRDAALKRAVEAAKESQRLINTGKQIRAAAPPDGTWQVGDNQKRPPTKLVTGPFDAGLTPEERAAMKKRREAFSKAGLLAAEAFQISVKRGAKYTSVNILQRGFREQLKEIPPEFRTAAAASMVRFARGLEEDGRLPEGAAKRLKVRLTKEYGDLPKFMRSQGMSSARGLAAGMKMDRIAANAESTVKQIKSRWGQLPPVAKLTSENAQKVFSEQMRFLARKAANSTGQMRKDALRDLKAVRDYAEKYGEQARIVSSEKFRTLVKTVGPYFDELRTGARKGFEGILGAIRNVFPGLDDLFGRLKRKFEGIKSWLSDAWGNIDLPDLNLPDIQLPDISIPTPRPRRSNRERTGGVIMPRFMDGGLVPSFISSGEQVIEPGGRSWIAPGTPTAMDNIFTMLPAGSAVMTFDGQARMAAGESLASALANQAPHFQNGGRVTPASWARSLLSALGGVKEMTNATRAVMAWVRAEGGAGPQWGIPNNRASYNPINTSWDMPGAGDKVVNSHGVRAYTSWKQGLQATLNTLRRGNIGGGGYPGIIAALRSTEPMRRLISAVGGSPWGTNAGLLARVAASMSGQKVPGGGRTIGDVEGDGRRDKSGRVLVRPARPNLRPWSRRESVFRLAEVLNTGDAFNTGFDAGSGMRSSWRLSTDQQYMNALLSGARVEMQDPVYRDRGGKGGSGTVGGEIRGGNRTVPRGVDPRIARMIRAGNEIDHLPYHYGGGHGGYGIDPRGYDCSGAVSRLLHAGGFLQGPPVTTDSLKTWGRPGAGKLITVGVRGSTGQNAHTMMRIGRYYFEAGGRGVGWFSNWNGAFDVYRHPAGYRKGGAVGGKLASGLLNRAPIKVREKLRKNPRALDPNDPDFVGFGFRDGGRVPRVTGQGQQPTTVTGRGGKTAFATLPDQGDRGVIMRGPIGRQLAALANLPARAGLRLEEQVRALVQTFENVSYRSLLQLRSRIENQIRTLMSDGTTRRERVQIVRLRAALSAIDSEAGYRTGRLVQAFEQQAAVLARDAARFGQMLRREGIDESSSKAMFMTVKFLQEQRKGMRQNIKNLERARNRAMNFGQVERAGEIQAQIDAARDELYETGTQIIETRRNAKQTRDQEVKDYLQALYDAAYEQAAKTAEEAVQAAQKVVSDLDRQRTRMEQSFRIQGIDLNSSVALRATQAMLEQTNTTLQQTFNELAEKQRSLLAAGQADAAKTVGDEMTSLGDTIAENAAAIAEAARQAAIAAAQEAVDAAQHGANMADIYFQQLELRQRLAGTFEDQASRIERANYITNSTIPALEATLRALEGQRDTYAALGDVAGLRQAIEAIGQQQIAIMQAQLDAQELTADNTAEMLKEMGGATAFEFGGQQQTDIINAFTGA